MVGLSEEQEQFLKECEEEFKDRYTENDEDFIKVKTAEPKVPPIIDPWPNTHQRSNNWSQQSRDRESHQNWRQRHGRDRMRDRDNRDRSVDTGRHRDRDRDRDRDRGGRDSRYAGRQHEHSYKPY